MGKLEQVRSMDQTGPQLLIIQGLRELNETMKALPDAVAQAVAGPLEPMDRLQQQVLAAVKAYEETNRKLMSSWQRVIEASEALARAADRAAEAAPSLWQEMLKLVLAGVIAAMLVGGGRAVFDRLLPPTEVRQELEAYRVMWQKATPKERELMQQIIERPNPS